MDDEYLRLILTNGYFNNHVGQAHFAGQVARGLQRRPGILFDLYRTQTPVIVEGATTVSVDVDRQRFDRVIDHICRGLHFHLFGHRWQFPISVFSPSFLEIENTPVSDRINTMNTGMCHAVARELRNAPKQGENPDVFWFQTSALPDRQRLLCRMMFYGGFDVFAVADPLLPSYE